MLLSCARRIFNNRLAIGPFFFMEQYIVIKEIGRGSFGRAIKAVSRSTNTYVVIKQIETNCMTPRQLQEAMNEVNVLKSLTHPNIVRHFDNFIHHGKICLVMEFAPCGDLDSRIRSVSLSKSFLTEDQIGKWFVQILQGLSLLHARNIMHRDLKPQNIFITDNGERVMIGDFGVCKVLGSKHDLTSTITGTPYYLSPEIFQGKPYSFKSDIWSLGCILYQLVALQVPYDARDVSTLSARVTRGSNPPFPSRYSRDLRDIFHETMQRDFRSRPSSDELLTRPYILRLLSPNNVVSNKENVACNTRWDSLPPLSEKPDRLHSARSVSPYTRQPRSVTRRTCNSAERSRSNTPSVQRTTEDLGFRACVGGFASPPRHRDRCLRRDQLGRPSQSPVKIEHLIGRCYSPIRFASLKRNESPVRGASPCREIPAKIPTSNLHCKSSPLRSAPGVQARLKSPLHRILTPAPETHNPRPLNMHWR
jgi:NIMA (never in mitosis gene a)-related kinase